MKAEIITIGDEILIGQITDTNSVFIAEKLGEIGIQTVRMTSVGDNGDSIINALNNAKDNADIIIMTGGLGPTDDDITKLTLAEYFNSTLVINKKILAGIKKFLINRSLEINKRNIKQAELPDNCKIIPNKYGTASGMWFERYGKTFISLPGVAYEMRTMIEEEIIPGFKKKYKLPVILHKTILTNGLAESDMAEKIKDWENDLPGNMKLAYLPSPGILRLRLSLYGDSKKKFENDIKMQVKKLNNIIPENIFGYDNDRIEELVGLLLKKHNCILGIAESCTGGKISELITSVPGSSAYFKGSVVAYSNEIKRDVLGVTDADLNKHGAVSETVVRKMAEGVSRLYKTDYAIATSGIAGPDGGTDLKPVGTTWIAVASKHHTTAQIYFSGEQRGRNIIKASVTALCMLRKLILDTV
jgi:nicotinamide-nucleotide amidase